MVAIPSSVKLSDSGLATVKVASGPASEEAAAEAVKACLLLHGGGTVSGSFSEGLVLDWSNKFRYKYISATFEKAEPEGLEEGLDAWTAVFKEGNAPAPLLKVTAAVAVAAVGTAVCLAAGIAAGATVAAVMAIAAVFLLISPSRKCTGTMAAIVRELRQRYDNEL